MKLTQSKLKLIEKIIKDSPEFSNNEDLFDEFLEDICNRTKKMINLINSAEELESYIKKITKTSILSVLKSSGRLKYRKTEEFVAPEIIATDEKDYYSQKISYDNFLVAKSSDNILVPTKVMEKIIKTVSELDDEEPNNQYLKIYKLRYDGGLTQKEIAEAMNLSQAEICKRLFQLMEKVKKSLN